MKIGKKALSVLDQKYKYNIKVALDNTYGMHLYSKLKITKHIIILWRMTCPVLRQK
jgi:hypothetical protein